MKAVGMQYCMRPVADDGGWGLGDDTLDGAPSSMQQLVTESIQLQVRWSAWYA